MQAYQGMGSTSLPVTHVALWVNRGETLASVVAAHQKSPSRACGLCNTLPKVPPIFCSVCLSPSVSPTWISSRLFSPRCMHSPPLALLFLATLELTFINGEFMCMTALKPELRLEHPGRMSVNSCNHRSAKFLLFRGPLMEWLKLIYRIKSISSSADLHWYWYGVISSWLHLSEKRLRPEMSHWFTVPLHFSQQACARLP